jgi:hypothetical protein
LKTREAESKVEPGGLNRVGLWAAGTPGTNKLENFVEGSDLRTGGDVADNRREEGLG